MATGDVTLKFVPREIVMEHGELEVSFYSWLLFEIINDNRKIKEPSIKTQGELSKEITNLKTENERDRIHELEEENRKLRKEVLLSFTSSSNCNLF